MSRWITVLSAMLLILIIIVAMISQSYIHMVVHFILHAKKIISWEVIIFFISLTLLLNSNILSTLFVVMIFMEFLALIWRSTLFKVFDCLSVKFNFPLQSFLSIYLSFVALRSFSQDFKSHFDSRSNCLLLMFDCNL